MTSDPDFLVDTNMLGLFLEMKVSTKSAEAARLEARLGALTYSPRFFICPIVVGEIEYGIQSAPNMTPDRRNGLRQTVSQFSMASTDKYVAQDYYAVLRSKLYDYVGRPNARRPEQWKDPVTSRELGIQENDLWIVATAMAYNLTVLTNDKMKSIREVARLNGLSVSFDDWLLP